jgi:O-antigen/teichoic acid export membrane protein
MPAASPLPNLREVCGLFRSSHGARTLFAGTGVGGAVMLANKALTFLSAVVLARLMGVEGYGIYGSAIALMGVLGVFAELGLVTLVVREVARAHVAHDWAKLRGLIRASARMVGGSSLAIIGAGAAMLAILHDGMVPNQWLALAAMLLFFPLNSFVRLVAGHLNGLRRVILSQVTESLLAPTFTFLALAGLFIGDLKLLPQEAITVQIISTLAALCIGALWLRKAACDAWSAEPEHITPSVLVRQGWPFLLISSAMLLNVQMDTVLVNLLNGNEATGYYRVASQGAMLSMFGIQVVTNVTMPYFARLYASGDLGNLARLYRVARYAGFVFALAIFLFFLVAGRWLIAISFGSDYLPAYPLLLLLTGGYVGNTFFGPAGSVMSMSGHEKMTAGVLWFTAALNLVVSSAAAIAFGAVGVAAVTGATITMYHAIIYIKARRLVGI